MLSFVPVSQVDSHDNSVKIVCNPGKGSSQNNLENIGGFRQRHTKALKPVLCGIPWYKHALQESCYLRDQNALQRTSLLTPQHAGLEQHKPHTEKANSLLHIRATICK
jgi:hypothetical protein